MKGFGSMSLHLDSSARVKCITPDGAGPQLLLDVEGCTLAIVTPRRAGLGARDVEIARRLIDAATAYRDHLERLIADRPAQSERAVTSTA